MSTRIARFNIMITATAQQVGAVFSKLGEQSKAFGGNLVNSLTTASFAFNQISGMMQPFIGAFTSAVSELDELSAVAGRLNIDPNFLQTWRLAGRYADASAEQVDRALMIMQRKLGEFQLGIGGKGLEILGLGKSDLTGNFEQDLTKVTAAISGIEDRTARAAAVTQIFGKQGQELMAVFDSDVLARAAADIESWNGQLSGDNLDAVAAFDDAWIRTTESIKALRNSIVVELAPTMTQFANLLTEWVPKSTWVFRQMQIGWTTLIQSMVDALSWFVNKVDWVLQKLGIDALSGVNTFLDSFSQELEFKIRELEQAGKAKVAGDAKAAVTAVAEEMAKPEYNPINAWLDRQSVRLLTWRAQQFAEGFAGVVQGALGKGKELVEAVIGGAGAGAVQAGSVEAAKFAGARVQQDQLTELKAIRKSLENLGGAGLQTGLQIITQGLL